jgi:quercetin dioxygenase-like cupin family protein
MSKWQYHRIKAPRRRKDMRTKFQIIAIAVGILFSFPCLAQTADSGFPKGELSTAKNHTGNIWLIELVAGDSTFDPGIAMATYDAGAKLDWHIHPGGQVLLITEGTGYYQERGKPGRVVHKGDVVKCAPGVEHWHGATPNSTFAYIAVTPTQKGKTVWLKPVSDEEYNSVK